LYKTAGAYKVHHNMPVNLARLICLTFSYPFSFR
jgi:hypothetical protein